MRSMTEASRTVIAQWQLENQELCGGRFMLSGMEICQAAFMTGRWRV